MKKLIFILIIFILCPIYGNLMAWDTNAAKYMPLKVGNVWVYLGYSATIPCHGSSWYDKYKLTGTTQINGKTYFLFSHTLIYITGDCSWSSILFSGDQPIRVDSVNMNVYKKDNWCSSNESLVDSLRARFLDTSWECGNPQGRKIVCNDTSSYNFCGISRPTKSYRIGEGWDYVEIQKYAKDIGLVSYYYYCGGTYQISLQGCVIDGMVCGDTAMPVGILIISTNVPNEFKISQNYPNPFNPTTKIRFDIPQTPLNPPFSQRGEERSARLRNGQGGGFVTLKIYDILGREVTTLVNEQLKPGTYEVSWDAANYPSGVYFYSLQAGDYSETKKMVLIK